MDGQPHLLLEREPSRSGLRAEAGPLLPIPLIMREWKVSVMMILKNFEGGKKHPLT